MGAPAPLENALRAEITTRRGRGEPLETIRVELRLSRAQTAFAEEPPLAVIWAAVQANTVLRELDDQDSREIAVYLGKILTRVLPGVPRPEIEGVCLFAAHIPSTAVRIALGLDPRSRRRLLDELKYLAHLRMVDLASRRRRRKKTGR